MTFITDEILSEGGLTATTISGGTLFGDGSNLTGISSSGTFTGGTVTGATIFTAGLSATTLTFTTTPTNNNANTQILTRNSTTGDVEYRDSSSLGGGSIDTGKVIALTQIMYF
jgi:hypothetical protein